MGGYIGATAVGLTTTAADVQGDITSTDTTPELILKNTSEEDTEGGREGKITFKGEQSGGEETTLAQIESAHDGTSDDEKGDLIFKTNDGNDGAAPTERLRLDSAGDMLLSSPDPSFTITNTTQEDTDGGRESTIVFKGEQSGGELSTLAEIEASHDGTADDEKGDLIFRTNDGSDGASPTEAMRITSEQRLGIGTNDPQELVHLKGADPSIRFEDTSGDAYAQIDTDSADEGTIRIQADPTNVGANSIIRFDTDGSERMRINADGRVGIGVAPSTIGTVNASLQANQSFLINYSDDTTSLSHNVYFDGTNNVAQSTGTSSQYYQNGGNHIWRTAASVSAGATVSLTERMRIDSSGDLLHGKTSTSDTVGGAMVTYESAESGGRFTATANGSTGGALFLGNNTTGNVALIRCDGDMECINNRYTGFSDERLKENIVDSNSQWDDVKSVRVRKFSWKADELDAPNKLGVIAQELEALGMSSLVSTNEDLNDPEQERKSVAYSILYMKAFKALQEAMTRIETLETQNTTQATQIADLITRVEALEGA